MPQELRGNTPKEKMDDLYALAAIADKSLGLFMREVNSQFTGVIQHPGLKKRETAEEKLLRSDSGGMKTVPDDPTTLRDIARATIQYGRLETMLSARDYIQTKHASKIETLKDRYSDSKPVGGYRDVKFFIKLPAGEGRQLTCELQLNIGTALLGKELEHPIYEILRRAGLGSPPAPLTIGPVEAAKLGLQMRGVYIAIKRIRVLDPAEIDALRKVTISFFTSPDATTITKSAVTIQPALIMALQKVTPKLFKHYEAQALAAKVMTANGLKSTMTLAQAERLT